MALMRAAALRRRGLLLFLLFLLLLGGLPLAVWCDLRNIADSALRRQAEDFSSVITGVRGYYAQNVVGRVLNSPGKTEVTHNYQDIPGAIPIPATLSLDLGRVISEQQQNITYRFVSDYPFRQRPAHALDDFERRALETLRADPRGSVVQASASLFTGRVRQISPVIMSAECVGCHNTHPDSPKRDWKVGDVRGIQEVAIAQPLATNILDLKFLLVYFLLVGTVGAVFMAEQRRQSRQILGMNRELESKNEFLSSLSGKISHYLSPQVYKSIFAGQTEARIHTTRKTLTIFFSDIKDFTATTERLQPEQLTRLLNEYFTEMSRIADAHGGTIDKFVGDAILIFFGDPESRGEAEDARACLRMALGMQRRLEQLQIRWRAAGVEQPFQVRMGINTGYCNVGNFGSEHRMDYTIIGGEANLAARLQAVAEPGQIVISYETYALVRGMVEARPLPGLTMKGIAREVVPYLVEGPIGDAAGVDPVFRRHRPGLELILDPSAATAQEREEIRRLLREAMTALDRPDPGADTDGPADTDLPADT